MGQLRAGATKGSARTGQHWKSGRCLRIGVVVGGHIVEERLLSPGGDVTVGSDARCTIVVHGMPRKTTLIETRPDGGGQLHFTERMRGKLTRGGGVQTLRDLVESGDATLRRGRGSLRLGATDRGKVRLGETTVLFQFVRTPPTPAKRRRRGRFGAWRWGAVDWFFLAFVLISALAHTAGVMWVESQPPPTTQAMRHVQDIFIKMAMDEPEPEPEPEPAVADSTDGGTKKPDPADDPSEPDEPETPDASTDAGEPPPDEPEHVETAEERLARLQSEVEGTGLLLIGSNKDRPGASRIEDFLADAGRVDSDVRQAVAQAGTGGFARPEDGFRLREGSSDKDGVAGSGDIETVGGGPGGDLQKESVVVEVVESDPTWTPPPTGTAYDVPRQVRRFLGRIKACYEKEIKDGSDIEGKIVLSWTIEADGNVADVYVDRDTTGSQDLRRCVVRRLGGLPFKAPGELLEVEGYPLLFSRQ